jgi:hypothetical protein
MLKFDTYCPMNYDRVLRILYAEKEKIDRVIASLEELEAIASSPAGPQTRAQIHEPGGAP